eukprot:TRINITY_DN882_c0_g1_i1.p1 TRINITY_DN882_c0_g1~~TRINITY_DN882_c0_g1_i1.p1  ORF type:complete len:160 (-),score=28.25 TRINITY_DN882_c0_g1_i1:81-560(-)
MASELGFGGVPLLVPSNTALKYLHHAKVMDKSEVPVGASYRAKTDMESSVRGYREVKRGIQRRLSEMEKIKTMNRTEWPILSTSGVSASKLNNSGHEHFAPMDPIFYHEKSCSFRNTYSRCPLFKRKIMIGWTEPRNEESLGYMDIRRKIQSSRILNQQ